MGERYIRQTAETGDPVLPTESSSEGLKKALSRLGVVVCLVPLGLAGGYLIWVLAHLPRIVGAIKLNPDATWATVLVRDLSSGTGGGLIYVGEASHFTSIWFLMATEGVAIRNFLWDVTPFVIFLGGLGLTAWACWKAAGKWAALLGLSVGVSAGEQVLLTVMSHGLHGHTFFTHSVLAAFLVFYSTRPEKPSWTLRLSAGLLVVALTGATLASDPLVVPSGLVPFLVAPAFIAAVDRSKRHRELALMAATLTVLSVASGLVIGRWMHALGFRKTYATQGYALASPAQALRNLGDLADHTLRLGNAFHRGSDVEPGLRFLAETVMGTFLTVAAIIAAFTFLNALRFRAKGGSLEQPLSLFVVFWVVSGVAMAGAFSLSTFAAGPSDTSRYVIPIFFAFAAAAVLPARSPGWKRGAVVAGAGLFCILSIANRQGLFHYEQIPVFSATAEQGTKIVSFLEQKGATVGYAGYFNSHSLTQAGDLRVSFYPVLPCRLPESAQLCPFPVNSRSVWYRPRPGARSFVLDNSAAPDSITAAPLPEFGTPSVSSRFGSITVYVYDYDIASRLARPCPLGSPDLTCPRGPRPASTE